MSTNGATRHSCALLGAVLALASLATGCSEERPVRSFAQPNLMRKADLVGDLASYNNAMTGAATNPLPTWYYLQTVIDAPPSNGTMFVGLSSELIKGRFDIQEGYLYYRRSYEQIGGTEDMKAYDPRGYRGQPLAAWKVSSHFDLIRDYSSVTGEQTNKIIESQERPWQEREFIRIDWSQNLVTDYIGIGLNLFFGKDDGITVQPVSFWEADPTSPDGFYKEFAQTPTDMTGQPLAGDPLSQALLDAEFQPNELTYFDVTNEIVLTPQDLNLVAEQNGTQQKISYPKCFLANEIDDCASQIIKVRHGFAKISDKHDYVARDWDGIQMQRFGIWDVGLNRLTYNRNYGITNTGFVRHAARFNLWKQSYPKDKSGHVKLIPCADGQGNDQCGDKNALGNARADSEPGLQCGEYSDGTEILAVCQIAPQDRQLRTIPYYAQSSERERHTGKVGFYDRDIFGGAGIYDGGVEVVRQWNEALKTAYTDATKDRGADRFLAADNAGKIADRDILVLCHVPVKLRDDSTGPKDADACWQNLTPLRYYDTHGNPVDVRDENGDPVYRPRQGDPRRSTIFWVNQMQASGPLGYGPPLFDPQTGETISGQAYIFGAALETYATRSRDLALLLINQIKSSDYIDGANVAAWVQANRNGTANREEKTFTHDDLMNRSLSMDFNWALGLSPEAPLKPDTVQSMQDSMTARSERIYATGVFGTGQGDPAADRRNRLHNQPLESMLIQPDQLQGLGRGAPVKWEALTDAEKARVSPLRSQVVEEAVSQRLDNMAALGVDFGDFFDEGILQRVLLAQKDPTLVDPTNKGCDDGRGDKTCFDSEKLRLQLKKDIFVGVTLHEMGHNMGLRHNFRASYDAMNYFPDYWQLRDKGRAATKNCLGQPYGPPVVGDPFEGQLRPRYVNRPGGATSDVECNGSIREYQYSSIMDYGAEFNSDLHGLGSYDKAAMKFSYAQYLEAFTDVKQDQLNDFSALQSASSSYGLPTPLKPTQDLNAITYTQFPNYFVSGIPGMSKRADLPAELAKNFNGQNPIFGTKKSGKTFPVVPYYFCSDEYAGNLTCQRFDAGADAYEQAQDVISRYNNFYLANNFKRNRYPYFAGKGYVSRIRTRYFEVLRQQMTWYTLLRSEFQDFLAQTARLGTGSSDDVVKKTNEFFAQENQWGSFTAAVTLGFDTLGEVIARPSYGSFISVPKEDSNDYPYTYWQQFRDTPFGDPGIRNIAVGQGRHENTTWDFARCGYYWYDECTTRIGYFIDKTIALDILTESQAYFTGRDTATDVRKYAIGYYRLFPQQMQDKLGAILAGDYKLYAPRFSMAGAPGSFSPLAMQSWTTGKFSTGTPPPDTDIIEPATGFTLQIYAGLDMLAQITSGFDHSVIENTQIFIVGNGEATVPDVKLGSPDAAGSLSTDKPDNLVSSCNPTQSADAFNACLVGKKQWFVFSSQNGRMYASRSVPRSTSLTVSGSPSVLSAQAGTRMVQMLQTLENRYTDALKIKIDDITRDRQIAVAKTAMDKFVSNIEVMRSLHKAFGYGPFKTDAPFYY